MANVGLRLAVVACLMLVSVKASVGGEEGGLIHVSGKIICQDCTKGYNDWINGERPIEGSTVSIICMDERKRVVYYKSDTTDDAGQFDLTVNKVINGKKLNEKLCSVRVVSSPDKTCDLLTDFAAGKSGVKLRRPTLVYRDLVKYMVGPFYFTNRMCDQPDTSDSDDSNY